MAILVPGVNREVKEAHSLVKEREEFSRIVFHLSLWLFSKKTKPRTRHQENISSAPSRSAKSHKVSILSTLGSGAGDSWANGHIAPKAMYFSEQN